LEEQIKGLKILIKIIKYIEDFDRAIAKKSVKKSISYVFNNKKDSSKKITEYLSNFDIPENVVQFLLLFNGLTIDKPRLLKILDFNEIKIIENQFLFFALINETEKICFDMSNLNNSNEWNIVSYESKFLITKTLSSFLTNKVWAWIERGRTIWKEEFYD
jgi:uncharacterized protein YcgL (UPF0745 family)